MTNNKKPNETIILTIRSRDGAKYDKQEVFAITSRNLKGPFDVLPEHENFISIIRDKVIVHKTRKDSEEIKIDTGIIKVNDNLVNVFLGMHAEEQT